MRRWAAQPFGRWLLLAALLLCKVDARIEPFHQAAFRPRVYNALRRVRSILNSTRHPQYPADVPHAYEDKYLLAEFATKAGAAALVHVLDSFAPGWWARNQGKLLGWSSSQSELVALQFSSCISSAFERTEKKEVDVGTKEVTESRWGSSTVKTVTTIQEHFWKITGSWEVRVFPGVRHSDGLVIQQYEGSHTVKTVTAEGVAPVQPREARRCIDPEHFEVDITWLLDRLRTGELQFAINRTSPTCATPRRNSDIFDANAFFAGSPAGDSGFGEWALRVRQYFGQVFFPAQHHNIDLSAVNADFLQVPFSPVLGLFALEKESGSKDLVLAKDFSAVIQEHQRSLAEQLDALAKLFPSEAEATGGLVSLPSVRLVVALGHAKAIISDFTDTIDAIESMLRSQLIAAVGKEIRSADFEEYMAYHTQRLFKPEYAPTRLSFPVRRPGRSPEGLVSLEAPTGPSGTAPILALTARKTSGRPMRFALSASADVSFGGDRFLHALVLHRFDSEAPGELTLMARARQFSSFVLLVGKIASADRFEPAGALIIKDRDDLVIPLLQETMPTPKEFQDAVASLSPEQRRFATAFRAMQLSNTVFGLCIIQIKPQMERLLNLPPDSLTKEIQLTQELMELFIKYQVPPDLLSYDDGPEADAKTKLEVVKHHVASLWSTINATQQKELDAERNKHEKKKLEEGTCGAACGQAAHLSGGRLRDTQGVHTERMGTPAVRMMKSRVMETMTANYAAPQADGAAPMFAKSEMLLLEAEDRHVRPPDGAAAPEADTADEGRPGEGAPSKGEPSPTRRLRGQRVNEEDYAALPAQLDAKMAALDEGAMLRPTKLEPGRRWVKLEQEGLLSPLRSVVLGEADQRAERDRAFDLLDALSRSGALPVEHASLHVILAATHGFDQTLIDTVVQGNVNPIEQVERSLLIMATTVQGRPAEDLVATEHLERLRGSSPAIFRGNLTVTT